MAANGWESKKHHGGWHHSMNLEVIVVNPSLLMHNSVFITHQISCSG